MEIIFFFFEREERLFIKILYFSFLQFCAMKITSNIFEKVFVNFLSFYSYRFVLENLCNFINWTILFTFTYFTLRILLVPFFRNTNSFRDIQLTPKQKIDYDRRIFSLLFYFYRPRMSLVLQLWINRIWKSITTLIKKCHENVSTFIPQFSKFSM